MFDEGPPDNEDLQWDLHQAEAEIERLQKENAKLQAQLLAATPSLPYTPVTNGDLRLIRDQALRIQKLESENERNLTQSARLTSYAQFFLTFVKEAEGLVRSSLPAGTKVEMLVKRLAEVRDVLDRRAPLPETKNEINPDDEPDAAELEALRRKVNPEISRLDVIIDKVLETFPEPWVFASGRHLLVDCASSRGPMEVAVLSKDDDCEKEMQALRHLIREIPSHLFKTALALRRVLMKLRNDVDPEVPSGCWASSVQALEIILSELKPNDEPAAPVSGT